MEAETATQAAVLKPAAETKPAVESGITVETDTTVKTGTTTELSQEEQEAAKALLKAKHDSPKVTPRAKGVVIKENVQKVKETGGASAKDKGKGKMDEPPTKKKKLMESDELLAKKLQEQFEKDAEDQIAKDREIAKALAEKLNEEFQKSLQAETAKQQLKSLFGIQMAKKKRQPSRTSKTNLERKKMIDFLTAAVGVKRQMFTKMPYNRLAEMYRKEMDTLQGDSEKRVEAERKMKEMHDVTIDQPFPETEEETPTEAKETEELPSAQTEEPSTVQKEETLGESIKKLKRTKMKARVRKGKKPRTETTKEEETAKEGQTTEDQPSQSSEQFKMYMTEVDDKPLQTKPLSVKPPAVIYWDTIQDGRKEMIRIKRTDGKFEVFASFGVC